MVIIHVADPTETGPDEGDEHSGRVSMKAVGVSGHTWVMEGKRSFGV